MSKSDTVAVVLLTYNRPEYAKTTLLSLFKHLHTDHHIWLHIADDGTGDAYRRELIKVAESTKYPLAGVSCTSAERRGYGHSYNLATQVVHSIADYILPLEDDWECLRTLYLDNFIQVLSAGYASSGPSGPDSIGCVRMGYVGYTQELRGRLVYQADKHWLLLDPDSPEPHVFAGHPRLETRQWERGVGPWPEDLEPGATEFAVAHLPAARRGVVWPVDLVHPSGDLFAHIGAK